MQRKINEHKTLEGNFKKKSHGRPGHRWEDAIKTK
jgi:hypothetical protein